MKQFLKQHGKNILCIICVMMVVSSFSAGCSFGNKTATERIEDKADKINDLIKTYYLNEVDEENVEENIYKGILNGLDDPYSVYYTKEEYDKLQEETSGSYVGIGVSVRADTSTGYVKVVKAFENGPAYKAGVRADDYITAVEGTDIKDMDLDNVVAKIRGKEGSKVKVTFQRPSDGKEYTFEIERRSVDVPTIASEMLENKIGYIQISEFDLVTADQYKKALNDLEQQGIKGLIIDLRDNPGGVLGTVVDMLDNMLPKGTIVYTKDKNGKGETYSSSGDHEFKLPLVVLVNGNSASASEIFTGAVKDYGIGTIVGTTTFGKGIVQKVFSLNDGSAVKLTISKYFTPNGTCIHGKGIAPDVEIEYDASKQTGEVYNKDQDNQLQKAIEVIKGKME